jgi:hypothetical protein
MDQAVAAQVDQPNERTESRHPFAMNAMLCSQILSVTILNHAFHQPKVNSRSKLPLNAISVY